MTRQTGMSSRAAALMLAAATLGAGISTGGPNIAEDFARHQDAEQRRRNIEAAEAKRERKAKKRLRDAARASQVKGEGG